MADEYPNLAWLDEPLTFVLPEPPIENLIWPRIQDIILTNVEVASFEYGRSSEPLYIIESYRNTLDDHTEYVKFMIKYVVMELRVIDRLIQQQEQYMASLIDDDRFDDWFRTTPYFENILHIHRLLVARRAELLLGNR